MEWLESLKNRGFWEKLPDFWKNCQKEFWEIWELFFNGDSQWHRDDKAKRKRVLENQGLQNMMTRWQNFLKVNRVWMFRGFIPYGIKPRFRKSDKEWQGGDKAEWTETQENQGL